MTVKIQFFDNLCYQYIEETPVSAQTRPLPAYLQIRDRIVAMIDDGTLQPGDRLPPTREPASSTGLHRSTVVRAFEETRALILLVSASVLSDFRAETTLTGDTVPVNVNAIAFWMVWDAEKAVLEVENQEFFFRGRSHRSGEWIHFFESISERCDLPQKRLFGCDRIGSIFGDCGSKGLISTGPESVCSSSPKLDNRPALYARSCPPCRNTPYSIVNHYSVASCSICRTSAPNPHFSPVFRPVRAL